MTTETNPDDWKIAAEVWRDFAAAYPILGLNPEKWAFTNFMRHAKADLVAADVLRKANGKHWIASASRFPAIAFELVTKGKQS